MQTSVVHESERARHRPDCDCANEIALFARNSTQSFRPGGKRRVRWRSSRSPLGSLQRARRAYGACMLMMQGDLRRAGGRACIERSCISARVLPGRRAGM
eukprot:4226188-Pleurochrysis_carterae.AAC.1